jgi:hypothetical protein
MMTNNKQEMTNDMIINLVSKQKEESEEEENEVCREVVKKMSHTEGLNAMETAPRYVEHHTCRSFVAEVPMEHSSKEVRNCNYTRDCQRFIMKV